MVAPYCRMIFALGVILLCLVVNTVQDETTGSKNNESAEKNPWLESEGNAEQEKGPRADMIKHQQSICPCGTSENLSLRGRATQSSFVTPKDSLDWGFNSHPINAIDGNIDCNIFKGSCTHTQLQANPWWRVALAEESKIVEVRITGREDCCPDRLNNAHIHIGNSLINEGNNNPVCAVVSRIGFCETAVYKCNGMVGRYVTIHLPGVTEYLTLCEVQIIGCPIPRRCY